MRAQIAIGGGRYGAPVIPIVVLGLQHQQARIFHPLIRRIGERHRRPHPTHRVQRIALAHAVTAGAHHLLCGPCARNVQPADTQRQIMRAAQGGLAQKAQVRLARICLGQNTRIGGQNAGRLRAVIGDLLADAAFGKAGVGTGIEREGVTVGIRQTRGAAGVETGVEKRCEVCAVIVDIVRQHCAAVGKGRLRGGLAKGLGGERN